MATFSQTAAAPARPTNTFTGPRGLIDKCFYFAMSLLFPVIVISGFSRTVDGSLFHAAIPRPLILRFHAAAFFGWIIFFLFQSALVRTRNVKWHRFWGWFGVALGAAMVPLGVATAIIMGRFDTFQLHLPGVEAFLIVPFFDMAAFATLFTLAILSRKKPEQHRRFIFIATCVLLGPAFGRFEFIFDRGVHLFCPDLVILLGLLRDLLVNRRIHRVYLIMLPILIASQAVVTFVWRAEAGWWIRIAHAILA
jgi:hypothetical protein